SPTGRQALQRRAKTVSIGAADAAIAHLAAAFLGVSHQNFVVDVLFTALVFAHRDLLTMGLGQHPLEQCGFARTEKAGEDGGGNKRHVGSAPGWSTAQAVKTRECSPDGCRLRCAL